MRITCLIFALLLISCARTPGTSISMMESMPSGRWSMEKRTSKGGAQIIDRQLWDIVKKGNVFKVRMDFYRMAHSMSGFPCNGSPSYNLHMRFDFSRAHLVNGDLVLGTPTVKHTPNACDERLPELKGATLRSHRGGRLLYVQSKRAEVLHPFSLTGVWSYKRVTPNKGNIDSKIEIEEWNLVQHRDRSVSGFYDRIVVRKSANRRAYSCNAKEEIWFFERYTVSGKIEENGTLSLKETAYQIPANDACEPTGARYLDSFTGILAGDTVRLKSNEDKIEQTLERKYGVSPVTSWGKFTSPLGQPKSTQRNFSITK